jgi:hypothetical protein
VALRALLPRGDDDQLSERLRAGPHGALVYPAQVRITEDDVRQCMLPAIQSETGVDIEPIAARLARAVQIGLRLVEAPASTQPTGTAAIGGSTAAASSPQCQMRGAGP